MNSLLVCFLKEEVNPHVRKLICDAVRDHEKCSFESQKKFEFNRFELTLDFDGNFALIEDVLDSTSNGEVKMRLADFVHYVASS